MKARLIWVWSFVAVLAAGCATSPLDQFAAGTPALTPGQVAELQKRAQPPAALGIRVAVRDGGLWVDGAQQLEAAGPVTVPLVAWPAGELGAAGNDYRVPVLLATVNGRPGVPVMLDSGSNRLLLGYTLARHLGVPAIAGMAPVPASGIGGRVDNYLAVVPELQLDTLHLRRLLALVGPDAQVLKFTAGFGSQKQVLILGVNALRGLSYLTIDNLRGRATLAADRDFVPEEALASRLAIPLRWEADLPVVDVVIDGQGTRPCILDTGGDYGLLLPRHLAKAYGYWEPGKERMAASHGVGGASLTATFVVRQIQLGQGTFVGIPGRTDLSGPAPAGGQVLLGNVVLRRHKVTFDFRRGLLWLER